MGLEVVSVPPNWNHPKTTVLRLRPYEGYGYVEEFKPMYDRDFDEAAARWKEAFAKWEAGEKLENPKEDGTFKEFWEWGGFPPDRKYYRPWKKAEATWFQLWETETEGTPVSPPFATKEELAEYLAVHGDYWDKAGWGIDRARAFVKASWAPSFVIETEAEEPTRVVEGKFFTPNDCGSE
jgi:hypothetical protein